MLKTILGVLVGIMLITALTACEMPPAKEPAVTEPAEPTVPVVDQELDQDLAELDKTIAEIDQLDSELDTTEYEQEFDVTVE